MSHRDCYVETEYGASMATGRPVRKIMYQSSERCRRRKVILFGIYVEAGADRSGLEAETIMFCLKILSDILAQSMSRQLVPEFGLQGRLRLDL